MIKKSLIKIVCLLLIVGLNWTGLLAVGQTFAFFSNTKDSDTNTFTAATLDLSLRSGQGNFISPAENMKPGDSTARDIYVGKTANSLPLKHSVSYNFIDGNEDFCSQLELKIWYNHYFGPVRDMRLKYDESLTSLTNLTDIDFIIPHPDDQFDTDPNDGTEQWFFYSIILPSTVADSFQGEVCKFKFVYEGWQDNIANYGDGGFSDIEEIENTIKVGYWNPPVVLNEFLPSAGNYPEYIELYNKTASSINLEGFYIKAGNNIITIDDSTTALYSGGSTTISPNGWLVVTTGGNLIDDTSGTVTLYNQNDVEVDSYAYDASDYNVNNTPGWTNDLAGYWSFDGDVQDISANGNNGADYSSGFVTGKINQGLSFDGVNDYVAVNDSQSLDFSTANGITIEAWIFVNTWGNWKDIVFKGDSSGSNTDFQLALVSTGFAWDGTLNGNWRTKLFSTSQDTGQWIYVAVTHDTNTVTCYRDGVSIGSQVDTGNIYHSPYLLAIGREGTQNYGYFDGKIDEVKIYNRALDATEISEHYSDVGPSGAVPLDKSYARIPDGIGYWVDPIPTPGGPNILELEIINQEEAIEEEPIVEEEPLAEELPAEETPVSEEESVSEREPVIEEEPAGEEVTPVPSIEDGATGQATEGNQEEGGIIEEINEIIDEVIEEIVDEIMPEEETGDEVVLEPEVPVIEEPAVEDLVIEEAPVVDEQPAAVPDGAGENVGDGGNGNGGGETGGNSDGGSPAEGAGESL